MGAVRSKTFKAGNSEAVRLPRGIGFGPGTAVRIERRGDEVVIARAEPERLTLAEFAREMLRRGSAPGGTEVYERFEFPERPGLDD